MDKRQENYEKVKAEMLDHKRKLETDPEYRKRSEETKKVLDALWAPFEMKQD
jgi:hypothetical protein